MRTQFYMYLMSDIIYSDIFHRIFLVSLLIVCYGNWLPVSVNLVINTCLMIDFHDYHTKC